MGASDSQIILWQFAYMTSWMLLPLVPSVLIYLIFPKARTSLSGPFKGLTLKTTGAFAAYLVLLLISYPLWNKQDDRLNDLMRPTWEIAGRVQIEDERGKEIGYSNVDPSPMEISLRPNLVTTQGPNFRIVVPEIDNRVPAILIKYPGYGDYAIDPGRPNPDQKVHVDRVRREIDIQSPLVIQRKACQGICGPPS